MAGVLCVQTRRPCMVQTCVHALAVEATLSYMDALARRVTRVRAVRYLRATRKHLENFPSEFEGVLQTPVT